MGFFSSVKKTIKKVVPKEIKNTVNYTLAGGPLATGYGVLKDLYDGFKPKKPKSSSSSSESGGGMSSSEALGGAFGFSIPERDYYKETHDTLKAQLDLAPDVFAAESTYRPKYADLDYSIYSSLLPKYLQTRVDTAPLVAKEASILNTAQRTSDINDVMTLGPKALEAYRTSNPDAAAILDELTSQAKSDLALGGDLSDEEERSVVQNSRAAYNDRGLMFSDPSVLAEVLNLDTYGRQRQNERRGFAGNVLGLNKAIYGDAFESVLGRPNSNLVQAASSSTIPGSVQTGPQLFNPESPYASSLYGQNSSNAAASSLAKAGYKYDYWNTLFNADVSKDIAHMNNEAAYDAAWLGSASNIFSSLPFLFI